MMIKNTFTNPLMNPSIPLHPDAVSLPVHVDSFSTLADPPFTMMES